MLARLVMSHARPTAGPQFETPVPATPMPIPYLSVSSLASCSSRIGTVSVQFDGNGVRAFLDATMGNFPADTGARANHHDNLAGKFFLRGHPLEFRFFEQPIFDVEGLLLRQ